MTEKALIKAALGQRPERRPIWFLRQAGRYLPEYRQIRAQHSFMDVCQNPKLASEVTLQPLRRYDLDAAIIFSDILVVCAAVGQQLSFNKGEGPVLTPPIRSPEDFAQLKWKDAATRLQYVGDAIAATKVHLKPHQSMIGFAGAPLTVACYMIEGQGSRDFLSLKTFMYHHPKIFGDLLRHLAELTCAYMSLQKRAGAESFMLFDTWASVLTRQDYRSFVVPALSMITAHARSISLPLTYYPGQGWDRYEDLGLIGDFNVLAVDWRNNMAEAITKMRAQSLDLCVQGNLDPSLFLAPQELLRERCRQIINEAGSAQSHIFNVGHGLVPSVPPDALNWAIEEIRAHDVSESLPK